MRAAMYQKYWTAAPAAAARSRALRLAAAGLIAATLGLSPLTAAGAAPRLSLVINSVDASGFPWVTSYVTALNENGQTVLSLGTGSFEVLEDGVKVERLEVNAAVNAQEQVAVVVAVDLSGSTSPQELQAIKDAASVFINGQGEPGPAALMAFSTQVRLVEGYTGDRSVLLGALQQLETGGNSAFYDGLFAAVEYASNSGVGRTMVVLITDGLDTSSRARLDDGINLARQKGIPVYPIGIGAGMDRRPLSRIAESTGASPLFSPTSGQVEAAYKAITDKLRQQYVVKYFSPNRKGAKTYQLTIKASQLLDRASAETSFKASPPPPVIRGLSLEEGAVVSQEAQLSVDLEAARPVTQVALEVNGRKIAQRDKPPYTFSLRPEELKLGRHQVNIAVTDEAGGTASKRFAITVPPGAKGSDSSEIKTGPAGTGLDFGGLFAWILQPLEGMADGLVMLGRSTLGGLWTGIEDAVTGAGDGVNGMVKGVTEGVRIWTMETVPDFLSFHQKTLLGSLLLALAAGVLATQGRRIVRIARGRLQKVTCPDCHGEYRAYEERCNRCWTEQQLREEANRSLGGILVENGLLSREDLEVCLAESTESRRSLAVVLLELGQVTEEHLSRARFYLERSTQMVARKRELFAAASAGKRMWEVRAFLPQLIGVLVALVASGMAIPLAMP